MKYVSIIAFLLISLRSFSQIDSEKKALGIKCCKITYEFFNGPQKGTKTLIIEDWGRYTRTEGFTESDTAVLKSLNIDLSFLSEKQHELIISTPDSIYVINLNTKTGYGRVQQDNQVLMDLYKPEEKIIGTELYLGKSCTVTVVQNFLKIWSWNGICLKKQVLDQNVRLEEYALIIDDTYIVDTHDFQVPEGIQIR
jgi:hypothetical protein